MLPSTTAIKVFVHFHDTIVFAGDSVACTITFKNTDSPPAPAIAGRTSRNPNWRRPSKTRESSRTSRTLSRQEPTQKPPSTTGSRTRVLDSHGHRSTVSLGHVDSREQSPAPVSPVSHVEKFHRRRRSISITSLGTEPGKQKNRELGKARIPIRPTNRHERATSLQVTSTFEQLNRARPSRARSRTTTELSSVIETSPPPLFHSRNGTTSTPSTSPQEAPERNSASAPLNETRWQSPQQPSGREESHSPSDRQHDLHQSPAQFSGPPIPRFQKVPYLSHRTRSTESPSTNRRQLPLVPDFSASHTNDQPRASADLHSHSSNSTETLVSEYMPSIGSRMIRSPGGSRTPPHTTLVARHRPSETIMLGYAQVAGSFTLDGSLVNQAPFEQIKRKAVLGGQGGGGVVGIDRPRGESGLFGTLSWNSIGESLGDFLGSGDPSSIKEMQSTARLKSVPLLSTPKSVLFVNLKLAPGESKSYTYSFPLPRGLPPTHRGRAMRVSYSLIVGTQRAGAERSRKQQNIKQVEVDFRVFGGVNSQGDTLGHDLMSPYILLKDRAITSALEADSRPPTSSSLNDDGPQQSSPTDFHAYVTNLLTSPRSTSSPGLLSPTATRSETRQAEPFSTTVANEPLSPMSMRSLVALAAHRSTTSTATNVPGQSTTHFTIRCSHSTMATLVLSRPTLRLGDLLTIVIDFSEAQLPCYAIQATLESSERIDPALAIRSPQSIERATRRMWARTVENVIWGKRVVCYWQVPIAATPTFNTTGVSLEWAVKLEFVVGQNLRRYRTSASDEGNDDVVTDRQGQRGGSKDEELRRADQVMEEVRADERATLFAAVRRLPCESFEVSIPIRVFGAILQDGANGTGSEGLAV